MNPGRSERPPHVVAVGGGRGLAATIRAVRRYAGRTTAIVSTADDGGSSGRLRSAIDMPAPGDLRRCIEAMAGDPGRPLVRALDFRFAGSDVEGHALGNLLLVGLHEVTGDFVEAVDELCRLVGIDAEVGRVLPATCEPVVLRAVLGGAHEHQITGQVAITRAAGVERVVVEPPDARVPDDAADALVGADQVILGPGSLYTSVLAAMAVDGMRAALKRSAASRIYVCNVQQERSETRGYDVGDHIRALRRHDIEVDVVLAHRGALPLGDVRGVDVVEADLADPRCQTHDPVRLGRALAALVSCRSA